MAVNRCNANQVHGVRETDILPGTCGLTVKRYMDKKAHI